MHTVVLMNEERPSTAPQGIGYHSRPLSRIVALQPVSKVFVFDETARNSSVVNLVWVTASYPRTSHHSRYMINTRPSNSTLQSPIESIHIHSAYKHDLDAFSSASTLPDPLSNCRQKSAREGLLTGCYSRPGNPRPDGQKGG